MLVSLCTYFKMHGQQNIKLRCLKIEVSVYRKTKFFVRFDVPIVATFEDDCRL
jgi:hypothetical protein